MSRWWAILRPNRSELRAAVVLGGLMIAVCGVAIAWLGSFDIPAACFQGIDPDGTLCTPYQSQMFAYGQAMNTIGVPAAIAAFATPFVIGIVLGIALLARELEQQTTNFTWSIAPSRAVWLRDRLIPILLLLILLGLAAGWLGDLLQGLRSRGVDPSRNFEGLGLRGPVIAGDALLVFGISSLIGGMVGRQLPALIISGALIGFAMYGAYTISDGWVRTEAVYGTVDEVQLGDKILDSVIRTPEGEFISWEEAYGRYGDVVESLNYGETNENGLSIASQYVPGDRYLASMARLSALLAGGGAAALALTFVVVGRRRPY